MRRFTVLMIVVLLIVVAASPAAADEYAGTDGLPWWNDRVFYEIFVRAFVDSDGNANGDFAGLTSQLDYLNDGDPATTTDLGITGIWLMPVMESTSYHGYDVTDYRNIESDFGSNDDFRAFMDAAHERGIAVIVDMVINHTARRHPWFVESAKGGTEYDTWYRWLPVNPGYLGPWGQPVWHQEGNRFFYGVFWDGMPDLNLRNPDVQAEIYSIADFWLNDLDVDGFRLDAIKHLVEEGRQQENTPETLTWLGDYNVHIKSVNPQAFTVGEIFGGSGPILGLYAPEHVDTTFEFGLAGAMIGAARSGTATSMRNVQRQVLGQFPPGQYAAFLTNHDENRVMNELAEDEAKMRVAASLLLTQPGVPFLYYGEEIGMIGLKPDECIRTPMQWADSIPAPSYTAGKNCETNEATNNVAAQTDDPNSLLSHYRNLIHLRNAHSALRAGDLTAVDSASDAVYSMIRQSETETVMVIVNLSDEAVTDYMLSAESSGLTADMSANLLFGAGDVAAPTVGDAGAFADYLPLGELPPHSTFIIQLSS
jgi:glycosidase